MNELRVRDVMTNLVVTLRPEEKIPQAAKRLLANRISGAPVVEDGRLTGVVVEGDLMKACAPPGRGGSPFAAPYPLMFLLLRGSLPQDLHNATVRDVMTSEAVTLGPNESIWEAARLIDRHGVRRLPVVDDEGYVVGVLARSDLVRCMARGDDEVAAAVRRAIDALGAESFLSLEIEADKGMVAVSGTADRKSTKELAIRITAQIPGVLEVSDELDWQWDDTSPKPAADSTYANGIRREAWVDSPRDSTGI